jgi:saccharopine dehydrogenase-like NADP-dependent oxidoreductase
MKKITLLGAGLVGKTIAADLCRDFEVTAADVDAVALERLRGRYPVKTVAADLTDAEAVRRVVREADLVIGAVPGFLGFKTLAAAIDAGKNVVDISFFAEDAFLLDEMAKQRGVTAVVDCGVAPGMGNIILGYWVEHLKVTSYECLVGGLPFVRRKPFEYKAPFSPSDVLELYTRPARCVENGHVVVRPPLSDPELVEFEEVGTLEAFNTDGLRTLLKTMSVPNMKEKAMRYPGHIGLIRAFRDAGFFDKTPLDVNGQRVVPFDVTARLLFESWKLGEGEEEFTAGRITIAGEENGRRRKIIYELFDVYNRATGITSMARTTGYVCTAVAHLVLENRFVRKGICPPEYVGREEGCLAAVLEYLERRNVVYKKTEE